MKFWISGPSVICIMFTEGGAALVGNRTWPTRKPHYAYFYFETFHHGS